MSEAGELTKDQRELLAKVRDRLTEVCGIEVGDDLADQLADAVARGDEVASAELKFQPADDKDVAEAQLHAIGLFSYAKAHDVKPEIFMASMAMAMASTNAMIGCEGSLEVMIEFIRIEHRRRLREFRRMGKRR